MRDIRHLPYQDRLKSLKLPSLRYRRRRGDMIAVYQLLHGKMDLNPEDFLHRASARETRGQEDKWRLAKPQAVTRVRRNAFAVRIINGEDWMERTKSEVRKSEVNKRK